MFKNSFRAFSLLVIFLFSFPIFSQTSGNSSSQNNQIVDLAQDPGAVSVSDSYNTYSVPDDGGSVSTFGLIVKMVLVLAVVLGCVYLFLRFVRRGMGGTSDTDDPFLRKVSQVSLAPGKSVQVVTILDHAYILGVADNSVNLLGEISDKEIVDSMNLFADKNGNVKKPMSFSDVLDLLVKKGPEKTSGFSDFTKNAVNNLKQQRDNFNSRGN